MKITAITRYKHGTLYELLKRHGWSQLELSRRSGLSPHTIGLIINLVRRPFPREANAIQQAFGEVGYYFDVLAEWPETFSGLNRGYRIEQTEDVEVVGLLDNPEVLQLEAPDAGYETKWRENLARVLDSLPERERAVLEMRFLDEMTLKEVGNRMKLTHERIRQIEAKALRKLRRPNVIQTLFGPGDSVLDWLDEQAADNERLPADNGMRRVEPTRGT